MTRPCDWCGAPLPHGSRPGRLTCSDTHRVLKHKWLHRTPRAGGRPPIQPPAGSPLLAAPGTAPARSRSGLQVSYWRAVRATAAALTEFGVKSYAAELVAAKALRDVLPDRQRAKLDQEES